MILRHRLLQRARQTFVRPRLSRDRDADPHEAHARRRARLSGAVARASRRVLRAAAVAADLQAAADGGGLRPLLPDRALLPRRGPARRPAAGVHADRHRGVVRRRRRTSAASSKRCWSRSGARRATPSPRPFPRACRIATRWSATASDKPDLRYGFADRATGPRAVQPLGVPFIAVGRWRTGRACAASRCRGGGGVSRKDVDQLADAAKELGGGGPARGRSGRVTRSRARSASISRRTRSASWACWTGMPLCWRWARTG